MFKTTMLQECMQRLKTARREWVMVRQLSYTLGIQLYCMFGLCELTVVVLTIRTFVASFSEY